MKIILLTVGKTEKGPIDDGIKVYINRLQHYIPFELVELVIKRKGEDRNALKNLEG